MQVQKDVQFDRVTRDFACFINGELVGYRPTKLEADMLVNSIATEMLEDAATDAAPVPASAPAPALHNISRASVAAVLAQARIKLADDRRWYNALAKAATELEASRWAFDGQRLIINSRTTAGRRYCVEGGRCECQSAAKGHPCWHKAAYGLLSRAATGKAA